LAGHKIDGEIVSDFILGGSKITADGDCSHEIKRRLLLGRKVMTNLGSILKSSQLVFIDVKIKFNPKYFILQASVHKIYDLPS